MVKQNKKSSIARFRVPAHRLSMNDDKRLCVIISADVSVACCSTTVQRIILHSDFEIWDRRSSPLRMNPSKVVPFDVEP